MLGVVAVRALRDQLNTALLAFTTLKRGMVGSDDLWDWLKGVRDGTADPRTVTITLLDDPMPVVSAASCGCARERAP